MRLPLISKLSPTEVRARARAAGTASAAVAEVSSDGMVASDPTAAAFFDVDNTMMMGASIFHFARGLAMRKFLTTGDIARMVYQQVKFRMSGTESPTDIQSSRERALAFVKDVDVARITALGEEIYDEEMAQKIYAGTRALAQMHIDAGQRVWLVTATPVELASVIADRLGLTGALGTVAEHVNGKYTGLLVGEMMHGSAKAEAVTALARREGLDLSRCTAYSDSINDLPMLTLVGRAVVVNPDPDLRKEAIERGWEIREYRTGRRVVKIGALATLVGAATGGAIVGAVAIYRTAPRRWTRHAQPPTPDERRSSTPAGRLRRMSVRARAAARTTATESVP